MKVEKVGNFGVKIFTPDVYSDDRGFFMESFNAHYGFEPKQANCSNSHKGVVRGLHYMKSGVTKLVWVVQGSILDVALDLKTGKLVSQILSSRNQWQMLIPDNCAHGMQALENDTVVCYLQSKPFNPVDDESICPLEIIDWPIKEIIISDRDRNADKFSSQ